MSVYDGKCAYSLITVPVHLNAWLHLTSLCEYSVLGLIQISTLLTEELPFSEAHETRWGTFVTYGFYLTINLWIRRCWYCND